MQKHHKIFFNVENHAGDAAVRQAPSYFPQFAAKRAHQGHANRPRKLDILDICADDLSILCLQASKPLPRRLPSAIGAIKPRPAIALELR
jgi:hypothetical protein